MITNAIDAVKEFNKAFKIEYSESQEANLDESIVDLRYRLMQEENNEYLEAAKNKDLVEVLELPPIKIHCSVLAEDSIRQAIEDYESKQ